MNNGLTAENLLLALPEALRQDEQMQALAAGIAEVLAARPAEIDRLLIYPRIDELPEALLDRLAYDFKVDWWDAEYSLAAKRQTLKDNWQVHRRLGTKAAVEQAIAAIYPETQVLEWFEYGGEPFSFRVVLDVTNARASAEYFAIKRAVDSYKRLTAHMDNLIYQCRAALEIRIEMAVFYLGAVMTGQRVCGTYPQRSASAGIVDSKFEVMTQGGAFVFDSTPAGTRPQRSFASAVKDVAVQTESQGAGFGCKSGSTGEYYAGIRPQNSTPAGVEEAGFIPAVKTETFAFKSKVCGTGYCKK